MSASTRRARAAYALSCGALAAGVALAAARYPGGYDWQYTVLSALASRKHNPEGGAFFAGGLALALALLWPAVAWSVGARAAQGGLARAGLFALRAGIALGVLVGLERLGFQHLSDRVRKGHEALALLCFVCVYCGVLALQADRLRRRSGARWPALVALAPLVAIGLSQLALYLDPRDRGWVGPEWRAEGVPVWLSFAFWQWLAVVALWLAVGHLVTRSPAPPPSVRTTSREG